MKIILMALASASLICGPLPADEPEDAPPALERKLLGEWKGSPSVGELTVRADGTFERHHGNTSDVSGTWAMRWNELPPTLVLTCKAAKNPGNVGQVAEMRLVRLTGGALKGLHREGQVEPYERVLAAGEKPEQAPSAMPVAADAALVTGFKVKGKLTQSIGSFNSYGAPRAGDRFEIDLAKLPRESIQFVPVAPDPRATGGPNGGPGTAYMSMTRAPLIISRVRRTPPDVKRHPRSVIELTSNDGYDRFVIWIIADDLAKGSKVRVVFGVTANSMLGSMAEAEGVLE